MENELTKEESLAIISGMIKQAKSNVAGSSFFFLLWGWVALIGYGGHYTLFMMEYEAPQMIWLITIPAAIISAIRGARMRSTAKVRTYTDQIYGSIWLGLAIPFVALIYFGGQFGYQNITGLILLMVGTGLFITSRLLRFEPATYGAFVIWLGAIAALILNNESQFLIGGFVTILGYLIPGYMLKKREENG